MSGAAAKIEKAPGADDQPQLDLVLPFVGKAITERLQVIAPEVMANYDPAQDDGFTLEGAAPARRGPGRPLNSPNKSTAEVRKFLIATLGHPLVGTAMLGTWRSYDELVTKCAWLSQGLGVSREKALDAMLACNARILPYIEGQMPIRIDAKVAAGVTIAVSAGMFAMPGEESPPP